MACLQTVKAITPSDVVAVPSNPTIKSRRSSPDYARPYMVGRIDMVMIASHWWLILFCYHNYVSDINNKKELISLKGLRS